MLTHKLRVTQTQQIQHTEMILFQVLWSQNRANSKQSTGAIRADSSRAVSKLIHQLTHIDKLIKSFFKRRR